MQRVREAPSDEEKYNSSLEITSEEQDQLSECYASLNYRQLRSVRLDAAGHSRLDISDTLNITPESVTVWRKIPQYIKMKNIVVEVMNRMNPIIPIVTKTSKYSLCA